MKSNPLPLRTILVKKSDFLESLDIVYENASENYLTALINGLMIIKKHKFYDKVNFDDYKGLIQL